MSESFWRYSAKFWEETTFELLKERDEARSWAEKFYEQRNYWKNRYEELEAMAHSNWK